MRVMVVGGFGYLGGRIAQSLSTQGHEITLVSRSKRATPDWLSKVKIIKIDWSNQTSLNSICKNIDVIIHAAGLNAEGCASDPIEAIDFNGLATTRLVQASVNSSVNKFIYLSTSHAYSSLLAGNIDEESCLKNRHPYATSHVIGENSVLYYSSITKGFTGMILRLSNGIGSPAYKDVNCWMLAVNDFCRQAVENRTIEVNSSRKVERDFVPISLLCNFINNIINNSKIDSSIINVSSSKAISLQDIIDIIIDQTELILGFVPKVVFKGGDDVVSNKKLFISNEKMKNLMGVEMKVQDDLINEIKQLLVNCKKWYG
jgi:UDP-glucose 4-epimerase